MPRDMVQVRRPRTNQFAVEPSIRIGRSQFDRSHGRKQTFDVGYLYPILVDEVLPGDTFTCSLNGFARVFSPLESPIMDNIWLETFFFFVPNRIIWEHWEDMMGAHDAAGAQDTTYTVPVLADGTTAQHENLVTVAHLMACMGIPDGASTTNHEISALPYRAYNKIYNDWFRNQNLIGFATENIDDGPDATGDYEIKKKHKPLDYFTSALPYLQKGDAAEILGTLPTYINVQTDATTTENVAVYSTVTSAQQDLGNDLADDTVLLAQQTGEYLRIPTEDFEFNLNTLRESAAIQRLLETDARGGTRYVESIKAHFGVTSPDFRHQRPEFLGGGKSFINVTAVANTSATATEDQGELRGVATGVVSGHGWAKSFTEHGLIIGIMAASADQTYFQGIERHLTREGRTDYYVPALANLGEQPIYNQEIWVSGDANDALVFGYQERWAEYRWKKSEIVGLLNPDATSAISHWHLAIDYGSLPTLNATFLNANSIPMSRVTVVDTAPDFMIDLWFNLKAARPIPVHSVPSLIGRWF